MKVRLILVLILIIDTALLIFETSTLSITYHGASLLYGEDSLLKIIINASLNFFGHNDYALRLPMYIMHIFSVILLYKISKPYAKYSQDRIWLVIIYILLPGVNSAALLIDSAGFVLLLLFLYIYIYQIQPKMADILLVPYLFIDSAFLILFIGRFFNAIMLKQRYRALFTILLAFLSLLIFGFDSGGSPRGHFLDTLGLYATIFSPIIFIYIFYILYRRYVINEKDILWYIAVTALIISLLLSFRQRIPIENFAPYLMLSLPLAMQTFYHSYRVRLKQFRFNYRVLFIISLSFLLINSLVVLFNKELYRFIKNPKHHFAYRAHIAKELAEELREKNISCVNVKNEHKMQLRLQFYGISNCQENIIYYDQNSKVDNVTIGYRDNILAYYNVSKIHN